MAAFCGSEHVLEMLIKRYQQQDPILLPQLLNSPSDGATPLWLAARAGHTSCVKLLLEAGADASIPNRKGVTPLDVAIQRKRTEIINLLQDKPAPKS
jgi:ankyrin repeat protein